MVDEKHPDEVADRKVKWFKENDMSPPARTSTDDPADGAAALAEDVSADVEILAEHYELVELTSENFSIDDELETLSQRIEALAGRTPRYVETLETRFLALSAARPALENDYADVSTWESLEKNGDFD